MVWGWVLGLTCLESEAGVAARASTRASSGVAVGVSTSRRGVAPLCGGVDGPALVRVRVRVSG